MMKVLWCVCGGEYLLAESLGVLEKMDDVTVVFSAAAEEVASMYGLKERFESAASEVVYEERQGRSSPLVMRLGRFDKVVVAPCTANTAAKIVHGIADSLVANLVCQALKAGVPVVALPTDANRLVKGKTVSGGEIEIRCRKVDIDNVKKLAKEVRIVKSAKELKELL
jgi:dihydromethanopterin reductase (acceptor)